ncbi:hypothetical protein BCR33DRAFT_357025 [Rhizoclosmatium globosum]|uniref:Uncharacterized protein n=1 Tax=Rhizoclosmatium globosum TaxID=329046 RepID=A0A1Y2C1E8_9FUNG|nr:hypothetical protein BCR33DRAFT_357025 [Rhizoclosmatium globosum]|eukprot:ORY40707.1 hypothetical protein BCR33DRAFT_357025 [Rhizoclosmatium globosum]
MRVVATARPPVEGTIGVRKLTSGKERKGSAVPTTTRNNAPSGVNESAQFVQDPHWKRIDPSRPPIPLPHQNTTHPAKSPSHNRSLSRNRPKSAEREYARDMPFIVGTSTNKSHSVTANLQTVYALLKAHNPALCSVCTQRRKKAAGFLKLDSARSRSPSHSRSGSSRNFDNEDHAHHHRKIAEVGSGLAETDKLKSVLGTLQNDFNRLKL